MNIGVSFKNIQEAGIALYNNWKTIEPPSVQSLTTLAMLSTIPVVVAQNGTINNSTVWESPQFIAGTAGGALLILTLAGIGYCIEKKWYTKSDVSDESPLLESNVPTQYTADVVEGGSESALIALSKEEISRGEISSTREDDVLKENFERIRFQGNSFPEGIKFTPLTLK